MSLPQAPNSPGRRVSGRGWVIFAVAGAAVIVAAIVGIRGLLGSPIESVSADGLTMLRGTWEPYTCTASACEGYLQAGGRSVFIVFPSHCPVPQRAAELTVRGRVDTTLGRGSYRLVTCAN